MSLDFSSSFSIRPDSPRVSPIQTLSEFINNYPDEQLVPNLLLLANRYKYYRPICGDGNCFYRACIFLYFSTIKLQRIEDVFPYTPIKNCTNLPFDFEGYDANQLLSFIWKEYLFPMRTMNQYQRQRQLQKKLNGSVMLDAFLIAYFRSLNHQYLNTHRSQFLAFIEGSIQNELERVLSFGKESEGIELFAMAQQLKVKITIMMVHKENFQQIVYLEDGSPNYVLFYRPGHYQILCDESEYKSQGSLSSGIKNPSLRSSFLNNKQVKEDIVKINKIEDFSRFTGKSHLSYDLKKSNITYQSRPIQSIDEYYNKGRKIEPRKEPKATRLTPEILNSSKHPNQTRKNEFKPAQIVIPNINQKKMYYEGGVLLLVICLIVFTGISI